jgi:hypothetical protein
MHGQPIASAEVYDFDSKKWSSLPNMPIPRAASTGAVVRGNQIIVVGGVTTKQLPVSKVDCYDIDTGKWLEDFPPLPIGVVGPYVRLIDDQLYCIAGTDKKDCNQSVMYDFDKKRWNNLPRKPTPCYSCGGYLYDRKLIIVGGRNGQTPVQEVEAFCLDTRQWERLSSMSSIRVFYSVVGIEDEIYVMGGLVPKAGLTKIVERYSIHEDMWCRIRDLNELRSDCAYGVVGKRVVLTCGLGGADKDKGKPPSAMTTGEAIEYRGRRFKKLPQTSMPRTSLSMVSFNGKLAVMNGVGDGGPRAMVEILQVKETKKND